MKSLRHWRQGRQRRHIMATDNGKSLIRKAHLSPHMWTKTVNQWFDHEYLKLLGRSMNTSVCPLGYSLPAQTKTAH